MTGFVIIVLKLQKHRKAFYIIKTYTLKRSEMVNGFSK